MPSSSFEQALDALPDATLTVTRDGSIRFMNAVAVAAFRCDGNEPRSQLLESLVPAAQHRERLLRVLDDPAPGACWRGALVARRNDGLELGFEVAWRRVVVADEALVLATFREAPHATSPADTGDAPSGALRASSRGFDASDPLAVEHALRRSEASFRMLIERSPDSIVVHRDGRFVYVNPATLEFLGYEHASEMVGRSVLDIVDPADRELVVSRIRTMLASCEPVPAREERFVRKDGTVIVAEAIALPIDFDGQPSVVVVARDITERKQLSVKMMQLDRMIAVGTLAAGIGHEINNPLQYVIANLDFLARELPDLVLGARELETAAVSSGASNLQTRARELGLKCCDALQVLTETREGAGRVRKIVGDLRTFGRPEDEKGEPFDVRGVVESAVGIAWNEIRHRAKLVKSYGACPAVNGSPARLGQVVLNVLVNAAQAIPEGHADGNTVELQTHADGERVWIEIADSGAGIAKENLGRIFEPFFTTKRAGHGTGLGLAICRNLMRGMGGDIEVRSVVGRGSRFRLWLPASALEPIAPTRAPPSSKPPSTVGRHRVLVVDDEPYVGTALRRLLALSCECVVVPGAAEALALLGAGAHFDVIFSDLMMPEMSGMQFHAAVARDFPEHLDRIVFVTGGAFTAEAADFLDRVPSARLEKPIDFATLRAILRERLH